MPYASTEVASATSSQSCFGCVQTASISETDILTACSLMSRWAAAIFSVKE
jgi:hypothetical protein